MYVCIVIRKNFVKCNVTVLVLVLSENVVVLCAKLARYFDISLLVEEN